MSGKHKRFTAWWWRFLAVVSARRPDADDIAWAQQQIAEIERQTPSAPVPRVPA